MATEIPLTDQNMARHQMLMDEALANKDQVVRAALMLESAREQHAAAVRALREADSRVASHLEGIIGRQTGKKVVGNWNIDLQRKVLVQVGEEG